MSKTPTVLTIADCERLLNAIRYPQGPRSQTAKSFRNYLCCLFMLDAGLRVSEAIQLRRHMVWQHGQVVKALVVSAEIAKLHRSRIIPMTTRLKTEIEFAHEHFWINGPESNLDYLFHCKGSTNHVTARRIQQIVRQASLATLNYGIWPHVFRHSFANSLMRVTSIRVVQELLGHKNLTSTQVYTHPNSQDLSEAIAKM